MYHSHLMIDVGDNPDRERPARKWLRNLYRVHQRLCMGFPSKEREGRDAQFLAPYDPADFAARHVKVARSKETGFLFRVDPRAGGNPVIVVQSACRPDWRYAFQNAQHFLAAPARVEVFDPHFAEGQCLRFRLRANPTRRIMRNSLGADGNPVDSKWIGKRVPVPAADLGGWVTRRLADGGCEVTLLAEPVCGYAYFNKNGKCTGAQRLFSALYEGQLLVSDPQALLGAIAAGIGSGKGFGFGLLSVVPV